MRRALPLAFAVLAAAAVPCALAGCNLGVGFLASYALRGLDELPVTGRIGNAPPNVRIGYVAWVEQLQDGQQKGRVSVDLLKDKTITFDGQSVPTGGAYSYTIKPSFPNVADGTYLLVAWNDLNGNGIYEGGPPNNESRSQEVYRIRGQAAARGAWTIEQLIFTDKRLSLQYADPTAGLDFSFL